jgi:hypothetical protein
LVKVQSCDGAIILGIVAFRRKLPYHCQRGGQRKTHAQFDLI